MLKFLFSGGETDKPKKEKDKSGFDYSLVGGVIALACNVKEDISVGFEDRRAEYKSMFLGLDPDNPESFFVDALPQGSV